LFFSTLQKQFNDNALKFQAFSYLEIIQTSLKTIQQSAIGFPLENHADIVSENANS